MADEQDKQEDDDDLESLTQSDVSPTGSGTSGAYKANSASTRHDSEIESWLLKQVNRYPLLTSEEESRLFSLHKLGNEEARWAILHHHLRLPYRYSGPREGLSRLDLYQAGVIGLMNALRNFNPDRGIRFSTFATPWVRFSINRYVQDHSRIIRRPVYVGSQEQRIDSFSRALQVKLGRDPTNEELSECTNLPVETIAYVREQKIKSSVLSLDVPLSEGADDTFGSSLPSDFNEQPDEIAHELTHREQVVSFLNRIKATLSDDERILLEMRAELDESGRPMSFDRIGAHFGKSGEFIRKMFVKLRHSLKETYGEEAAQLLSE